MDTLHCCPACGQPDTLILLGSRDDRPHGWRWWRTASTPLYLCERCDALLEHRSSSRLGTWRKHLRRPPHADIGRASRAIRHPWSASY